MFETRTKYWIVAFAVLFAILWFPLKLLITRCNGYIYILLLIYFFPVFLVVIFEKDHFIVENR